MLTSLGYHQSQLKTTMKRLKYFTFGFIVCSLLIIANHDSIEDEPIQPPHVPLTKGRTDSLSNVTMKEYKLHKGYDYKSDEFNNPNRIHPRYRNLEDYIDKKVEDKVDELEMQRD